MFEDAIHALETAKQAGFYTVAVYDPSAGKDWDRLKKEADVAVTDMRAADDITAGRTKQTVLKRRHIGDTTLCRVTKLMRTKK